jgi:hypothetical protein
VKAPSVLMLSASADPTPRNKVVVATSGISSAISAGAVSNPKGAVATTPIRNVRGKSDLSLCQV